MEGGRERKRGREGEGEGEGGKRERKKRRRRRYDRERYGRRGRGRDFEDATLLILKMEEGATGQVIWQLAEVGKCKKTDSPLEPEEGIQLCRHLDLGLVRLLNCRVVREYMYIILYH